MGHKGHREIVVSNIIWIVVIGFIAGIIARFISPGPNELGGFIVTTVLGIAGAFVATFIGQSIGWYRLDQGAGLIGALSVLCSCCSFGIGLRSAGLQPLPTLGHAHHHAAGFKNAQAMVTPAWWPEIVSQWLR